MKEWSNDTVEIREKGMDFIDVLDKVRFSKSSMFIASQDLSFMSFDSLFKSYLLLSCPGCRQVSRLHEIGQHHRSFSNGTWCLPLLPSIHLFHSTRAWEMFVQIDGDGSGEVDENELIVVFQVIFRHFFVVLHVESRAHIFVSLRHWRLKREKFVKSWR